jgi:osmotically-inducible protein OsmY
MTTTELVGCASDHRAQGGCRIQTSVEDRLRRCGYAALSTVCCEFQGDCGVLHLRGSVPSYFLKQVAQELVTDLDGVRFVNNQINVTRSARSAPT